MYWVSPPGATDTQEMPMRRLINSTYITLDGIIENPMWTMPYFDDEAAAFAGEQTAGAGARPTSTTSRSTSPRPP
jgi:hypothetical protein